MQCASQLNAIAVLRSFIPELQQRISTLCSTFEQQVINVENQRKKHSDDLSFKELAADYRTIEQYFTFATTLSSGDQLLEIGITTKFKEVSDRISQQMQDTIGFIQSNWTTSSKQFTEVFESLTSQSTDAEKELHTKRLVELLKHLQVKYLPSFVFLLVWHYLKAIKDSEMDKYLTTIKPATEFDFIVKNVKGKVQSLEEETKSMIVRAHFDIAERNIPLLQALCMVLSCIDEVDAYAIANALSASLREKR